MRFVSREAGGRRPVVHVRVVATFWVTGFRLPAIVNRTEPDGVRFLLQILLRQSTCITGYLVPTRACVVGLPSARRWMVSEQDFDSPDSVAQLEQDLYYDDNATIFTLIQMFCENGFARRSACRV